MWTLPDSAFTVRRIEKPLENMIAAASTGRRDFERASIQITNKICVERNWRSPQVINVYNVFDGEYAPANVVEVRDGNAPHFRRYSSYWTGTLGPCEIFVVRNSHIATIFVHQLWLDDLMKAELEVARDAILEAPIGTTPPSAYKIAKELLPFGHGLFIALIRKERGG